MVRSRPPAARRDFRNHAAIFNSSRFTHYNAAILQQFPFQRFLLIYTQISSNNMESKAYLGSFIPLNEEDYQILSFSFQGERDWVCNLSCPTITTPEQADQFILNYCYHTNETILLKASKTIKPTGTMLYNKAFRCHHNKRPKQKKLELNLIAPNKLVAILV